MRESSLDQAVESCTLDVFSNRVDSGMMRWLLQELSHQDLRLYSVCKCAKMPYYEVMGYNNTVGTQAHTIDFMY